MLEFFAGLLIGVLKFYAWTVGLGLVALFLIMLVEGAVDLIRGHHGSQLSRSSSSPRRPRLT